MREVYQVFDVSGNLIIRIECNYLEEYIKWKYGKDYLYSIDEINKTIILQKKKEKL